MTAPTFSYRRFGYDPGSAEPVTVAECKGHSRIGISDDDTYIGQLIVKAREYIEKQTGRVLRLASYRLTLEFFPDYYIWIRRTPLVDISFFEYTIDGGPVELVSADYEADFNHEPPYITPASGAWPASDSFPGAVEIGFNAGYATAAAVPDDWKVAVMQLVSHWYYTREPTTSGTVNPVPAHVFQFLEDEWDGHYT